MGMGFVFVFFMSRNVFWYTIWNLHKEYFVSGTHKHAFRIVSEIYLGSLKKYQCTNVVYSHLILLFMSIEG